MCRPVCFKPFFLNTVGSCVVAPCDFTVNYEEIEGPTALNQALGRGLMEELEEGGAGLSEMHAELDPLKLELAAASAEILPAWPATEETEGQQQSMS